MKKSGNSRVTNFVKTSVFGKIRPIDIPHQAKQWYVYDFDLNWKWQLNDKFLTIYGKIGKPRNFELHTKHKLSNKYVEYKYVLSEHSLLLFVLCMCIFYCIVPPPYLLNTLEKETLFNSICNFFYVCLVNTTTFNTIWTICCLEYQIMFIYSVID